MLKSLSHQPFVIENLDSLKIVFEQLFNPIVITTSQLELPGPQMVYANKAFIEQTGYSLEELLGKTPRIFQGEKTDKKMLERLKETLLAGEFFQDSTVNYKKDGKAYWVEWNISSLYNQQGEKTHYFCVQHDISTFKELENSRKLLQEYKDAVDESSIVSKADKNGIITYVNPQFCKISGYSAQELIGKNHNTIRHPDMPSKTFKNLWHTIEVLKKPWHGKIKNRKKDGTHYWVESTINPILDTHGEIIEFIAVRHDITALENYQESLENRLDDTNQWLHEYEDAIISHNTMVKTTPALIITDVNENYSKLTRYTPKEMIGKPITDFFVQESLQNFETVIQTLQSGETHRKIYKGNPKEGEPFYIESFVKPIKNKEGEIIEYFILGNDVTKLINFHEEIEATQKEIVYKMGEIGESRSQETGNHVKRVAEYSRLFALLYGLSDEEAKILFIASPMHDIGKVAIPDNILNKPGKLTDEEFEVMKSHASIGYEVLKGSSRYILQSAATIAYEHHERWDGSGYPRGLQGQEIHIYGRITAISDVFDALGHARCYKPAWPLEKILALFKQERGKHFEPMLVDLFFDNIDKFLEIRDRFQDF